jgi:uncharacterized protein
MSERIVVAAEALLRERLGAEGTGHDFWHVDRVRQTALRLAREEGADPLIVELAALLHDIADHKFHGGDETVGPRVASDFLERQGAPAELTAHVCEIIATLSYKGARVATPMRTAEGMCVQDADRLDAIGAIGIARCFAYGGSKGRPIYDPHEKPVMHGTFDEYKSNNASALTHFHEKLLLLKDRMNTATGKRIAADRHAFMEEYLRRFLDEWDGIR